MALIDFVKARAGLKVPLHACRAALATPPRALALLLCSPVSLSETAFLGGLQRAITGGKNGTQQMVELKVLTPPSHARN